MTTEQRGRDEAKDYQNQATIRIFHQKLEDMYDFLRKSCERLGRSECEETPKIVCLRSIRDYPPVRCALYDKGYFPLTVDKKFVNDVAIMEIDNLKPPKEITQKHARRFVRMLSGTRFRFKRPPDDPSDTIIG